MPIRRWADPDAIPRRWNGETPDPHQPLLVRDPFDVGIEILPIVTVPLASITCVTVRDVA